MKNTIILIASLLTISAQADFMKPVAAMKVDCAEDVGIMAVMPQTASVDSEGISVLLNNNGVEKEVEGNVVAATEGGDPAIQIVINGFMNIIISGKKLNDAFKGKNTNRPYRGGGLTATVWNLLEGNQNPTKMKCRGDIAFY
jgi:hypothetical protein